LVWRTETENDPSALARISCAISSPSLRQSLSGNSIALSTSENCLFHAEKILTVKEPNPADASGTAPTQTSSHRHVRTLQLKHPNRIERKMWGHRRHHREAGCPPPVAA